MAITYAFLSANTRKCAEYAAQMSKHARALRILPCPEDEGERQAQIMAYLQTAEEKDRFALRETSNLFVAEDWERGVSTISSKKIHGERVYHVSALAAYTLDDQGKLVCKTYQATVEGLVDLSNSSADTEHHWWDDIFAPTRSGATYDRERDMWGKCSARQQAISQFVCDHLMFKRLRDVNFNPHKPTRAVDFDLSRSAMSVLNSNPFVTMAALDGCPWGLGKLLTHIVNSGCFFRSADSNRSGNYFLPPLSGIPRFKKGDHFWETTFQLHDYFHQGIPDPLYSGNHSTEHRNVYVAARLMSEGFTIILADMLFVEAVKAAGFAYDYSTRKINPLFGSLNLPAGDKRAQLKALLHANVQFANLGDEAPYRAMLKPDAEAALQGYTDTYKHFFVPDLLWSVGNYDDMHARREDFAAWTALVGKELFRRSRLWLLDDVVDIIKQTGADLSTYRSAVAPVFEHLFENVLAPQLVPVVAVSEAQAQSNAFRRYMIGLSFLYAVYRHVKGMEERGRRMIDTLAGTEEFSADDINRIRLQYRADLEALHGNDIVTADELAIYTEIFPLLSPRFLSYDFGKTAFQSVPEAIDATFGS